MKFIISQVLLFFIIINISQCQKENIKERLNNIEYKIDEMREGKDADVVKNLDNNCVKNFLNSHQSEKIFINEYEELIITVDLMFKCLDEDVAFNFLLNENVQDGMKQSTKCFEWKLQQLEPESPLVGNVSIREDQTFVCKRTIRQEDVESNQKELKKILGPLDIFSCGAVTGADDYFKFMGKGFVLKFGSITEELRSREKEKLKEWLKDVAARTTDCIIKRFEKDMEAHHKNQTLKYFYQQATTPIVSKDDSDYQLTKIINSIDLDCTKNQLNLPENEDLVLLEVEAKILIGSAMSKCIKIANYDFMNLLLKYGIDESEIEYENFIHCAKYHLKALAPDSKLVKNFISTDADEFECEEYPIIEITPFHGNFKTYKESVGGDLKDTTCGAFSEEDVKIFSYKALLILVKKNGKLKRSESKELFDDMSNKIQQFADCVMERVK